MSINSSIPDYDLADRTVVSSPVELRAMAHPLRETILQLLLERAATVAELASSVRRPKSTVAHHVNVLLSAGMLRVVRTRRVRAIDERYYGRTSRLFVVGGTEQARGNDGPVCTNALTVAAEESLPAYRADKLRTNIRHARITSAQAAAFWERVEDVIQEFSQLPRAGDSAYGFVLGLYPTDHPTLPPPDADAR